MLCATSRYGAAMDRHVFLDLEETVINNFHEAFLCNIQTVRNFLSKSGIKDVNIFSFAIWDEKDLAEFNSSIRSRLCEALGVNIISVPTQQQILEDVVAFTNNKWELWELSSVWGKDRSFIDFCRFNFKDAECILLDDVVPNLTVTDLDKNLTIELVNVNRIRPRGSIRI